MRYLIPALVAEALKMKRTLALWLTLLAPLFIVLFQFLYYFEGDPYFREPGENAWLRLAQNILVIWGILMLPLFITLETALIGALEHGSKSWKHLFALPVPRWTVYVAKQAAALALIGLSMILLWGLIILAGAVLRVVRPALGFDAPIPWQHILEFVLLTFLASWLILAFHTWVSVRWSSFVVATGVGIGATVAAMLLFGSDWAKLYPWTLPGYIGTDLLEGQRALGRIAIGCLGGIAVAVVGCWDVARRDVT